MKGTLKGGLIQLAGSAFNAGLSEWAAKRQYDRQLDFWQKQNDYNDPSAQRSRMEKAGFNPAAFASEVATNNVAGELSNVPGNEVMKNGVINLDALNKSLEVFGKLEQMGADTDLMRRQIELSFVEELIKNGEAYGIELDNEQKKTMLEYLAQEKEVSISEAYSRIKELQTRSDSNEASADESRASSESIRSLIEPTKNKLIAETNYSESMTTWNNELLQFEKDLKSAQSQQSKATAANQFAQAKLTNINSSLQEKYGDREYGARITSAEAAAKYADDLQAQAVKVAETTAALNENQAMTNEARVEIERAAQDLKERTLALEENKFAFEAVKGTTDTVLKIVEAATPW